MLLQPGFKSSSLIRETILQGMEEESMSKESKFRGCNTTVRPASTSSNQAAIHFLDTHKQELFLHSSHLWNSQQTARLYRSQKWQIFSSYSTTIKPSHDFLSRVSVPTLATTGSSMTHLVIGQMQKNARLPSASDVCPFACTNLDFTLKLSWWQGPSIEVGSWQCRSFLSQATRHKELANVLEEPDGTRFAVLLLSTPFEEQIPLVWCWFAIFSDIGDTVVPGRPAGSSEEWQFWSCSGLVFPFMHGLSAILWVAAIQLSESLFLREEDLGLVLAFWSSWRATPFRRGLEQDARAAAGIWVISVFWLWTLGASWASGVNGLLTLLLLVSTFVADNVASLAWRVSGWRAALCVISLMRKVISLVCSFLCLFQLEVLSRLSADW